MKPMKPWSYALRRLPHAIPAAIGVLYLAHAAISAASGASVPFPLVMIALIATFISGDVLRKDRPPLTCARCGAFGWKDDIKRSNCCPRCGNDRFHARGIWSGTPDEVFAATGTVAGAQIALGLFVVFDASGDGSDGGDGDGGGDGGGGGD